MPAGRQPVTAPVSQPVGSFSRFPAGPLRCGTKQLAEAAGLPGTLPSPAKPALTAPRLPPTLPPGLTMQPEAIGCMLLTNII